VFVESTGLGRADPSLAAARIFRFTLFDRIGGLACAFVARPWNLATHVGPDTELAVPRRQVLCSAMGLDFNLLTCPRQVHGTRVALVDGAIAGAGREGRDTAVPGCDGLVTDLPGVPLMAMSADCCLLVAVEPQRRAVGLMHAGWRGIASWAGVRLIEAMVRHFAAEPSAMLAAISPAAQPCCYEISPDLAESLAANRNCGPRHVLRRGGRFFLDMQGALRQQLISAGIGPDRIDAAPECTICDGRFFSYRREGDQAGRNALVVGWRR